MVAEPFLVCENLVKIYKIGDREVMALQGLDLTVARGEMVGIVGASGGGKTTLMNVVGGLDRPTAGYVWVNGQNLLKLSGRALDRYRRTQVGFVWQDGSRNLIPYLSAVENVALPMTLAGKAGREPRERAEALLAAIGLAERRFHRPAELSGGEQQRVAIAVALANSPSLLLADEPTGELDSVTALTIYDALRALNRDFGLTTLIVSHDVGLTRHVDRVVAIRDGKTAAETVRQRSATNGADDGAAEGESEAFEELAVLDSAGRLQVPKEYLEQFGIKNRVRLEVSDEGILIRPVAPDPAVEAAPPPEPSPASEAAGLGGGWRLLQGWRRWSVRSRE